MGFCLNLKCFQFPKGPKSRLIFFLFLTETVTVIITMDTAFSN